MTHLVQIHKSQRSLIHSESVKRDVLVEVNAGCGVAHVGLTRSSQWSVVLQVMVPRPLTFTGHARGGTQRVTPPGSVNLA